MKVKLTSGDSISLKELRKNKNRIRGIPLFLLFIKNIKIILNSTLFVNLLSE